MADVGISGEAAKEKGKLFVSRKAVLRNKKVTNFLGPLVCFFFSERKLCGPFEHFIFTEIMRPFQKGGGQ